MVGRVMWVLIYGFNLTVSPEMSYGVLECDTVMLQRWGFCNRRFLCNKKGALPVLDPVFVLR